MARNSARLCHAISICYRFCTDFLMSSSRLCRELGSASKVIIEPSVGFVATYPALYNLGMLAGDVESSAMCLQHYCIGSFYTGTNLLSLSCTLVMSMKECVSILPVTKAL